MPRRVITLDSEAHVELVGCEQRQSFRLAVASFDRLTSTAIAEGDTDWLETTSTADLWRWVDERTSSQHRTVVFAHNLSYDVRLTRALEVLPELGWDVRMLTVSDYGCWAFLRRSSRSLYLIDSLSHLPMALGTIAGVLNRHRRRLPDELADDAAWFARCRADVRVLREAVLEYLWLLYENDLGDFRTTGAGQAHAAYRHRFLEPKSVLVHADLETLAVERRACWAGRAEVWRHGEVTGTLVEYDYDAAYARIAQREQLPARLLGEFFPGTDLELCDLLRRYACLLEVDVETAAPVLPCEVDGRMLWPIGTYTTTVWDVELAALSAAGGRWTLRRVWCYERVPVLREWATWVLGCLDGRELGVSRLGRLVAKDWSRSLIGRFGLRYPLLELEGTVPYTDLVLRPVADLDADRVYWQLQVGRVLYEQTDRVESPNSAPAIMGYVMAACRADLWRCLIAAGAANVLAIDTDGLIVDELGAAQLDQAIAAGELPGLRPKGRYRRAVLRGPRNLDLDDDRRVSGVPRKAAKLAPGVYRGEVWESLPTALRRSRPGVLRVHERTFTVADTDPRRRHLADGRTGAVLVRNGVRVERTPGDA